MIPDPTALAVHAAGAVLARGEPGAITGAEAAARVRAIAVALPARPGAILITCRGRAAFGLAAVAVWSRGRAIALPPSDRPAVLDELRASPGIVGELDDAAVAAWADAPPAADLGFPPCPPDATVLCTLHTSGTTGAPKPVVKTCAQLFGEARVLRRRFEVGPADVVGSTVPAQHVYGLLFGVIVPLCAGATILDETPLGPEAIAALCRSRGATLLVATPAHLAAFTTLEPGALAGLRRIFSSGAALDPGLGRAIAARHGVAVSEILGSTETGGIASREHLAHATSAWAPLPGVTVGADAEGRMELDAPWLPAHEPRPMRCADRIELAADGSFAHLGRLDDVVKVGGRRIDLDDLRRCLLAVEGVSDAAVWAEPAPAPRGQRIHAAVASLARSEAELRAALYRRFDAAVLPRTIAVLEALPRTATGKLDRERLRAIGRPGVAFGPPESLDGGSIAIVVEVAADAPWFAGHFPGAPILPGAAQLEAIVWPQLHHLVPDRIPRRLRRVKFMRPIEPGAHLRLVLRRSAEPPEEVLFELLREGEPCTRGRVGFDPDPGA